MSIRNRLFREFDKPSVGILRDSSGDIHQLENLTIRTLQISKTLNLIAVLVVLARGHGTDCVVAIRLEERDVSETIACI